MRDLLRKIKSGIMLVKRDFSNIISKIRITNPFRPKVWKFIKRTFSVIAGIAIIGLVISGFIFFRHRQLCRYNEQVKNERILNTENNNLCPNFLELKNAKVLVSNAFNSKLPKILKVNDSYQASANRDNNTSSNCTDDLSPLCWLKQINSELEQTEGYTNLLMFGSDTRLANGQLAGNTDSMMLVSYHHSTGKVMLTSFTRDLYVKVNTPPPWGWRTEIKLTTIYESYGKEGLIMAIEEITGKPVHYYAHFSFSTFIHLIDQLGGIDIYLEKPFHDLFPCNELPASKGCFTNGHDWFDYPAGWNHFDSYDALIYARARYNSNDYERARRQQDIVNAIMNSALKQEMSLVERFSLYKNLYEILRSEVDTNVQLEDIASVMKIFDRLTADPARIVVDPYLGGENEIIYPYGVLPEAGWSTLFQDYTYKQFQDYINNIWHFISYYVETPKVLFINASGSDFVSDSEISKLINSGNPYWETKIITKELGYSGIRIYDFSEGAKVGSLRDIQSKLSGSLIFNAEIDDITKSDWGEDIVVIIGK
jgi:LCP family protein required for cell wall assembly